MATNVRDKAPLRIRWIRPAWLNWPQAQTYSSLPGYVLRELVAGRLLRSRAFAAKGRLIQRDSIDGILTESVKNQQPVFWGRKYRTEVRQLQITLTGSPRT